MTSSPDDRTATRAGAKEAAKEADREAAREGSQRAAAAGAGKAARAGTDPAAEAAADPGVRAEIRVGTQVGAKAASDSVGDSGIRPGSRAARGRRRPAIAGTAPVPAVSEERGKAAGRPVLREHGAPGDVGLQHQLALPVAAVGAGKRRQRTVLVEAGASGEGAGAPVGVARPAQPLHATAHAPDPADLLAWYDRHRRRLPWRAEAGRRADPYHVFLSEIMLQQTTVKAVGPYFGAFLARWPTVSHLAAAPLEEVLSAWAGLGYYARARNLHACAQAVAERHGGAFPQEEAALLALPGIGPYTAAAIAAIAFDRKASPVDGNIERVISRLHAVADPLPGAKSVIKALAAALTPDARPGDFAQAMMDLGATICTPRSPACPLCPFTAVCRARAEGEPALYPVKAAKGEKPRRAGVAFLAVRADGAVLLRTRPDKGLLAKMTEVPATPWAARGAAMPADPAVHAPLGTRWRPLPGSVRHVFTHFELELAVWRADLPAGTPAPAGARFVLPRDFDAEALPSLMRKVLAHGRVGDARAR